jgi:inosine-uridine nucleoside N-ribohydrolase
MPVRVWVDTDVALGARRGDVDDGFALAAMLGAARRDLCEIAGLSTVFGNTTAKEAQECARRICDRVGTSPPITLGAEKPGRGSAASEAIATLEAGAELLCLGPLTNVAEACRKDPSLPRRLSLRVVGGNLSSRGFAWPVWPFEFNFARDRPAARAVLGESWRSLTVYPLDVARTLRCDGARLLRVSRVSPLGAHLAEGWRRWLARARWRYLGRSFPVWDLVPALDAVGVLAGRRQVRGSLREGELSCLAGFDAEAAWRSFEDLLGI